MIPLLSKRQHLLIVAIRQAMFIKKLTVAAPPCYAATSSEVISESDAEQLQSRCCSQRELDCDPPQLSRHKSVK
jgi:hypothetical protein